MSEFKVNVKKIAFCGIAYFAAFAELLALLFPYFGYDNGFEFFMEMVKSYDYYEQPFFLFCSALLIIQMICSLALMILSCLGVFCFSDKVSEPISMVSVVASTAFNAVYMLEGVICAIIGEVVTLSFLSLFISVPIMVLYFVFKSKLKEKQAPQVFAGEPKTLTQEYTEDFMPSLSADKVNSAMISFKNFIPEEGLPAFREALSHANEERYARICMLPLKNPTTVLLFSIFLGGVGVDRFYIGDTGMGIAKLLLGGLTFGIWPFVDIFFCYKKAKENNLQTLLENLK